jgi:endo-1,4-beta-mannosidase
MNRREFIESSSVALAAGAALGRLPGIALGAATDDRLMRHRFGVNYVPSRDWYFCWNDWNADDIARDFDRIAEIGADHLRIMLIWPWFQPNPRVVSVAHLDRLEELVRLAAERKLDVLATLYTGWLSGYHFNPPYLETEPFYTSPKWQPVRESYLAEVSKRLVQHANFLGYDIGNEINCNWSCPPSEGDVWMAGVFEKMHELCPGRIHVNGVDQQPWFKVTTFSPQALVAQQEIVTLHCWPYWTGAGKYGQHLDKPYTQLPAAMAALARSHGNTPGKPIWLEEFGACKAEMPEADVPRWMELAVTGGVAQGISYFTWWASHDVSERFDFNAFEYSLGLLTTDNQIKEQGRMFKRLADAYRGKPVIIPDQPLPPPPAQRTDDTAWRWMLDWMK